MLYISTRGPGEPKLFTDVLLDGMAPDGGLYIPSTWPDMDTATLSRMAGLSYASVAAQVIQPFVGSSFSASVLTRLIEDTYEDDVFRHASVAPLNQVGPATWLLDLSQGPTLAFKDVALQLLGRMFDAVLEQRGEHLTIIGATSGDTGSAAIAACKGLKRVKLFILHPRGRVSEVQRRQMTTVDAPNIFNVAVDGSFDDCQALVKAMFADTAMRRDLNLAAINSINWARIMAQSVYYVTAALALGAPSRPVAFSVPTGNFGNVYAGYVARRLGLPIHRLIIATNENDTLPRFFETGELRAAKAHPTSSPSMDIQIPSNFERYLCDLLRRDHAGLKKLMDGLAKDGGFRIPPDLMIQARREFVAARVGDAESLEMIRACYEATGILIDPHTAVGLAAAQKAMDDPTIPCVVLSTANPAKFPDAVEKATGIRPPLPPALAEIMSRPERLMPLPNDYRRISDYIRASARD